MAAVRGQAEDWRTPTFDIRRKRRSRRAERKVDDLLRTLPLLGQAERANGGYILSA
jgi:hypothetical protein